MHKYIHAHTCIRAPKVTEHCSHVPAWCDGSHRLLYRSTKSRKRDGRNGQEWVNQIWFNSQTAVSDFCGR